MESPQEADFDPAKASVDFGDEALVDEPVVAGRYQLLRKLGEGGMAAVYLAEDAELGRNIALKIPAQVSSDESFSKRFRREGRAIAAIKHPNVCGFHDIAEHEGRLFMTMDYISGYSLADWIQQHPDVTTKQAVEIVAKIASGIQAAHDQGVVHRDLKAANVMMNESGEPIVTDFGMACWTDVKETILTPTGAMVGTPGYMSPEQITGDKEKIGPATDIYALGVLLYELLTGWMPFSGNLATLLGSVVSDPPPPPSTHLANLDPQLEAICLRALEKAPEDRWPSAAELADALEAWLEGNLASGAISDDSAESDDLSAEAPSETGFFSKLLGAVRGSKPERREKS